MTNCSNEEAQQNDIAKYSEAKLWFNNHKNDYNSTVLKYVKDFQWQDAIVTDGNIGKVVEIPFTLEDNLSSSNKKANLHNVHHRLMFFKDDANGYKLLYVQIFTDNEKSKILDNNYNYYTIDKNFNGKVFVQELSTGIGSKLEFKNGIELIPLLTSKMAEEVVECVWLGYWSEDGTHFEPIELMYCEGGGGGEQEPTPGYGGGGGGGTKTPAAPIPKPVTVITTASFLNNPCLSSVYSKLGGSTIYQSYLQKFDGNFSVANLRLSASNLGSTVSAQTSPPVNYLIDISFNTNTLNRPGIDIARTFMHEMLHAEMFRKLLSLSSQNGNIEVSKLNQMLTQHNYPGLYDYYTRYGINGMQHEQIAAHYTDTLISFLKAYDPTLTTSQYEALAWVGLKDTTSWNALSEAKKTSIMNTYNSWRGTAGNQCN